MTTSALPTNAPQVRWHLLYFVLAGFDVLTVALSLYLNHRIIDIHAQSIQSNERWAQRLEEYAQLRELAGEVNAPGNDVFDTLEVERENTRLNMALGLFNEKLAIARAELSAVSERQLAAPALKAMNQLDTRMAQMVAEARLIFDLFRANKPQEAGGRMATMDRKYASLNAAFAQVEAAVRGIQRAGFEAQHVLEKSLRMAEYLIAAAVVVMVLGVTLYGRRIAREFETSIGERERFTRELQAARTELEQRVQERTGDLRRSNAQLTQEIQERRQAEEHLRASEEEVRRLNEDLEIRVRQRTAALAAANKELEAFAYSVSHDLRAPLRGIDGWSQALLEDYGEQLDGTAKSYLDRVRAESQRMAQLIDDLLRLSRVSRIEMQRREVNLSVIASDVVEKLRLSEPQRRVEVTIAPQLTAHGDRTLLQQVVQNLLENAWKFTAKKDHGLIEFGAKDENGVRVFHVRDNGVGFDMAHAGRLFGAFQRLHKASDYVGSGVGLATVQRAIRRHGGQVWVESEEGKGTTFYFTVEEAK